MAKRRPFLAPEVLQISTMDCGVAAISCMLAGFGIDANYGRLRELCQTQVDGTSIDALEDLCADLGLDVSQHIFPRDLLPDAMRLRMPLIAVQEPAVGRLHFVVVWRRLGGFLQVMDPNGGRIWRGLNAFSTTLIRHVQEFSPEDWGDWFPSSSFREALERSARTLLSRGVVEQICQPMLDDGNPRSVADLDAALRLVRKTAAIAGSRTSGWRDTLFKQALDAAVSKELPGELWSLRPSDDDSDSWKLRCVVALGVTRPNTGDADAITVPKADRTLDVGTRMKSELWKNILAVLGSDARKYLKWIAIGTLALAVASGIELLLYRTALDIPRLLTTPETRAGAGVALFVLFAVLLGLETTMAFASNTFGRMLELKLRMKTLWAVPRVDDAFIKSRPTSDLAYRAQALSTAALLPSSIYSAVSASADLTVTLTAIALLDWRYAIVVVLGATLFVGAWMATRSKLLEIDTRLHVHASRLLNLLLDGLRGIRPIRLHGFQDAFRDEQLKEIQQWKGAALTSVEATSLLQSQYIVFGALMLSTIFSVFVFRRGDPRQFILIAFWSFRVPPIITRLIQFVQRYPLMRNAVDRLLEVTQYETTDTDEGARTGTTDSSGVAIQMRDVSLVLGGHTVLESIDVDIPAGQHLAVVGASGSGKSTIVSLLLGLHAPTEGEVLVDGVPLDPKSCQKLRAEIMWIDPATQLWNRSLGENLEYASRGYTRRPALDVLESSDVLGVLASVEKGLDTPLGAEGALVSGGEGQRIRIGRALFRSGTRLALLDEPFRGLDRTTRHRILQAVRRAAIRSTLIFVSHDISHALGFDRVLVIDGGKIIEDGSPQELATQESSFARMLNAEKELLHSAWSGRQWRRIRVEKGGVHEVDNRA